MIKRKEYGFMTRALKRLGVGVGALGVVGLGWMGTAFPQSSGLSAPTSSLSWQRIREFFSQENEDKGEGANRGSRPVVRLCLVSPRQAQTIWHRSPVLVWQGYSTVGVRLQDDAENVVWKETASEKDTGVYRAFYQGEPLQFGEDYDWLFYIGETSPAIWFPFQIMAADIHEQHAAELAARQRELESEGADAEAIALAKAMYFVENDLPSDALQVVFAVGEPSAGLVETREALVEEVCAGDRDRVEALRRQLLGR